MATTIGVLHPGEMGAAVAAALRSRGQDVVWASEGRGDANAVSPQTARAIGTAVETGGATFVDGGIVGSPPREPGTTRLYLSGPSAAALLLAVRETARAEGVEDALVAEWARSLPGLADQHARALRSAGAKGWRWVAEMEEIAAAFAAPGQPDGFHRAAAGIYRCY